MISTEITVAVITSVVSLIGVIITNYCSNKAVKSEIEIHQAVTDEKISELTREVREHNGFAKRMPVVEEKIKVLNHRVEDLEKLNM